MMKFLSTLLKVTRISLMLCIGCGAFNSVAAAEASTSAVPAYIGASSLFKSEAHDTLSPLSHYFPRPASLEEATDFWRRVFGEWQAHQVVLHDDEHLGLVYEVIELTGYIGGRLSAEQQAKVDERKQHLVDQINDLNYLLYKRVGLTPEQQNIYHLILQKAGRKALRKAAEHVRIQRGMKESFRMGLEASSRYNAMMREVFRQNHLPEDLAYLPHVESAFTTTARSPAGAVGVWQFMPVTGKRYLHIGEAIDERYDPILSTQGAAKYLAYAYHKLGDWGLAITSYNYGLPGMVRARREQGRDITHIIKAYEGASFGFASRNYYAEFLAVCDIMSDLPRYFPQGINYQPPPAVKRIEITKQMTSGEIAKEYHIPYTTLAALNPAWTKEAAEGLVALPASSPVWIPRLVTRDERLVMTAKKTLTVASSAHLDKYHLSYTDSSLPVWDLFESFPNGLSGQLAVLPTQTQPPIRQVTQPTQLAQAAKSISKPQAKPSKAQGVHIVQSGDSPYTIATKYSVHLKELLSINDISARTLIRPGQSILIPTKING